VVFKKEICYNAYIFGERVMMFRTRILVWTVIILLAGCATEKPIEKPQPTKEMAETFLNRGVDYSQKGQYKMAISDYNKAIEIDREFVVAYLNRGFTHSKMGEYEKAISDYSKAIEINPRYAIAYRNRGFVYRKIGEYDKAIADYTRAIEIEPKDAVAYYNRGNAYYDKGEYEKAWEDIRKAKSLGYKVPSEFLKTLRESSGRER
jgi:tetratricopeptide (TPR) repeat protein